MSSTTERQHSQACLGTPPWKLFVSLLFVFAFASALSLSPSASSTLDVRRRSFPIPPVLVRGVAGWAAGTQSTPVVVLGGAPRPCQGTIPQAPECLRRPWASTFHMWHGARVDQHAGHPTRVLSQIIEQDKDHRVHVRGVSLQERRSSGWERFRDALSANPIRREVKVSVKLLSPNAW